MIRNSLNEVIKLSDEQKKQIAGEIRAFYLDVRGEELAVSKSVPAGGVGRLVWLR